MNHLRSTTLLALTALTLATSCISKGDNNITAAEEETGRGLCEQYCNKVDDSGCTLSPDCEADCQEAAGDCADEWDEFLNCAIAESMSCSSLGAARSPRCDEELGEYETCKSGTDVDLNSDAARCAASESDVNSCYNCCDRQFPTVAQDGLDDWNECLCDQCLDDCRGSLACGQEDRADSECISCGVACLTESTCYEDGICNLWLSCGAACVDEFNSASEPDPTPNVSTHHEQCPSLKAFACRDCCESEYPAGWNDLESAFEACYGNQCESECDDASDSDCASCVVNCAAEMCPEGTECGAAQQCLGECPPSGTAPVPQDDIDDAVAQIARADCEKLFACSAGRVEYWLGSLDVCIDRAVEYWAWHADQPDSGITPAKLSECAASYFNSSCQQHFGDATCNPTGSRDNGEPCISGSQCETGWCAGEPFACGVCADFPRTGDSCTYYWECPSNHNCIEERCVEFGRAGDSCDESEPCLLGFTCVGGQCTPDLTTEGASCGGTSPQCSLDAGLVCVSGECIPIEWRDAGDSCGIDGEQVNVCTGFGYCDSGDCEAPPVAGDSCDESANRFCRWPDVCLNGTCVGPSDDYDCDDVTPEPPETGDGGDGGETGETNPEPSNGGDGGSTTTPGPGSDGGVGGTTTPPVPTGGGSDDGGEPGTPQPTGGSGGEAGPGSGSGGAGASAGGPLPPPLGTTTRPEPVGGPLPPTP